MRAEDLMTRTPKTVTKDQPVSDAVGIMRSEHCGVVPVLESANEHRTVGILTDRDVALKACCDGGRGPDTRVSEIMSSRLFSVKPEDDIREVRNVMERAGVHRVPVVGEDNELRGIISMHDLARHIGRDGIGTTADRILEMEPNN